MNEAYSKTNKRKKRHKSFGSLIKKSCKRLEMFEAESSNVAEDRILNKLQKMNDLIQVPVGKKLVTMEKKNLVVSSKNKKPKKKSDLGEHQTWIITENVEKPKPVEVQSKADWTVSECELETNSPSTLADNSQDLELVLSSSTSEEKPCIVSPIHKRRSVEITSEPPSLIKSDGVEISFDDSTEIKSKRKKISSEKTEFERISPNTTKRALRNSPQKLATSRTKSIEVIGVDKADEMLFENSASPRTPNLKKSLKESENMVCDDVSTPEIKSAKLLKVQKDSSKRETAKKASEDRTTLLTYFLLIELK